jgi:hypothetical protein
MNTTVVVVLVAVLLIAALLFFMKKKQQPVIYGSMGCPYTVSHREKYPGATFVDCKSEKCPDFVTAYPTTKWPDGKITIGTN